MWMYHSHVDESDDTNTGLIGPIIVTRKGMAGEDGSPKDVDREFVTMFTIFDENTSHYLDYNIKHFAGDPKGADMVLDDPGIWFYHCHVNDHIDAGMTARYLVKD